MIRRGRRWSDERMTIATALSANEYRQRLAELSTVAFWDCPTCTSRAARADARVALGRGGPRTAALQGHRRRHRRPGPAPRALFRNPGLPGPGFGATPTLVAAYQALLPGESAPVHSHSFSALRFGVQGDAARMTVDDQRVPLHPGDLLLTPSWSWHGHAHIGGDDPVVWFDGLDVPFVAALRAGFFRDLPAGSPGWTARDGAAPLVAGLLPAERHGSTDAGAALPVGGRRGRPRTVCWPPPVRSGATLDYRNPVTGRSGAVDDRLPAARPRRPRHHGRRSGRRRARCASSCAAAARWSPRPANWNCGATTSPRSRHGSGTPCVPGRTASSCSASPTAPCTMRSACTAASRPVGRRPPRRRSGRNGAIA